MVSMYHLIIWLPKSKDWLNYKKNLNSPYPQKFENAYLIELPIIKKNNKKNIRKYFRYKINPNYNYNS